MNILSFKRILLVKPRGKRGLGFVADVIPLGLEYLAASIEKKVDAIRIIDMELEKHSLQHFIDQFNPDLVGITMSAVDHYEGLNLAETAKKNGITTVLGGYHPTAIPDDLLSHPQVDIIIRGEGELTLKELVQKGSPAGVQGLSYKRDGQIIHNPDRPFIDDLDSLPFPARHLRRKYYKEHMNNDREYDVISMSRGCWGQCSFCCEPYMSKSHMRFRSPENILKELKEIVNFHNGKPLKILATDPHFMGNPKIVENLCDLLEKNRLDIEFSVMTRVDSIVRNPDLVKKMWVNGFKGFELGFESSNPCDLDKVNKGITVDMQKRAVEILNKNGVNASGTFVIGLPGQTEEEIKQLPVYAKKIGLMNAAFGIVTPYPGTEFYSDLNKEELIVDRDWTKYDEMHSVLKPNPLSAKRLEELETYCMVRFWTLNTFLDRCRISSINIDSKIPLKSFFDEVFSKLNFARNAGFNLRKECFEDQIKQFLEASIDAIEEESDRELQINDIIEMSRVLKVMGSQIIQISLIYNGNIISYIIKNSDDRIEYIKIISGTIDNATIKINIELETLNRIVKDFTPHSNINYPFLMKQTIISMRNLNLVRLYIALVIEFGLTILKDNIWVR